MKKLKKNKGILFWITGLSGSGKTQIARKIVKKITKLYGPTIYISGDDIRKIFELKKYKKNDRLSVGIKIVKFCKFITKQNINVIFAVVGLIDKLRALNKKNISNYVEIYIKSDIKKIIQVGKKKIYTKFNKNVVGVDIVPELPRSPDIIIHNKFDKSIKELSDKLLKKISKLYTPKNSNN